MAEEKWYESGRQMEGVEWHKREVGRENEGEVLFKMRSGGRCEGGAISNPQCGFS